MKISVITPSIRPKGLQVVKDTLDNQTFQDFEHVHKLSPIGDKPDLCNAFNDCLRRSKGELIVFLQDYTRINIDGLERMWARYQEDKGVGWTAPLGKVSDWYDTPVFDWRAQRPNKSYVAWYEWEIDWACIPRCAIFEVGGFDEDYDSGFSWENVDLAYRLFKKGWGFRVDSQNRAVAWDHDAHEEHPYRHTPNKDLWAGKQREIDGGKVVLNYLK